MRGRCSEKDEEEMIKQGLNIAYTLLFKNVYFIEPRCIKLIKSKSKERHLFLFQINYFLFNFLFSKVS